MEIFAAKTNALMSRAAARDLYDFNNMVYYGLFDLEERKTSARKYISDLMRITEGKMKYMEALNVRNIDLSCDNPDDIIQLFSYNTKCGL